MADLEKKIVIPVEANPKKADAQIDKIKKEASRNPVEIPVNIDVSDIKNSLKAIEGIVKTMQNLFKKDIRFEGLQKSIDDVYKKMNNLIKETKKGTSYINVNPLGLDEMKENISIMTSNIKALNDTKINIKSFEKLSSVLENIETLINSIVKGMNFDSIRPSSQVQGDIEATTEKLEKLAKTEEKINKLESYLNKSGIRHGKNIISFGDTEGVSKKFINSLKEYISLGGDLSKIKFQEFNIDTQVKEWYSLVDVLEILEDEGKLDIIDSAEISNDVSLVKNLRKELVELNKELVDAQIRENRDLNVSLDTKSVEEFSTAIKEAVQAIGNLQINIPEGFTFDGLSVENLNKIIGKLDEVVSSIKNISTLLSTGIDTSKLNIDLNESLKEDLSLDVNVNPKVKVQDFVTNIEQQLKSNGGSVDVGVSPSLNPELFIKKIEEILNSSGEQVKVNSEIVINNEDKYVEIINDEVITGVVNKIRDNFQEISSNFGDDLSINLEDFKDTLEKTITNVDYSTLFSSLRETLLDIVVQFQNSLQSVGLSSSQLYEAYKTIKGWNDADSYASKKANVISGERGAFLNSKTGEISNSFFSDSTKSFQNTLFQAIKDLSVGIDGEISSIYDTWVHSHPFRKSIEGLNAIGSDIGFSVSDLELGIEKLLKDNLPNMLLTQNYKFTNLDLSGISEEITARFIEEYKKELLDAGLTEATVEGKKSIVFPSSLAKHDGVYDLDKKSDILNGALLKAMSTVGIDSSRLKTGHIDELKVDLSDLQQEEQQAASEAKMLYDVLEKISDLLNTFNQSNVFKFDGIDTLISNLDEVKSLLGDINGFLNSNIVPTVYNDENVLKDNENETTTLNVKPNVEAIEFTSEIENQLKESGKKVKVDVVPNILNDFLNDDDIRISANNWVKALSDSIDLALQTNAPFESLKQAADKVFSTTKDLQNKMKNLAAESPIIIDVDLNTIGFGWDYDEITNKIKELASKDIVINIKGLFDETTFGIPFSKNDGKEKRERDIKDLDYILNVVKKIPGLFDVFKADKENLFKDEYFKDNLQRFGLSVDKLANALKNTGFADNNLKPTFSIPDSGAQHSLGVVGQNYVLLGRDNMQPATLEGTKIKQAKIDELADIGVNIARIILLRAQDEVYDNDTRNFFEVQERKPGKNHRDVIEEFGNMSKEQMINLLRDMKSIFEKDLAIELCGDNLLFDEKTGITTPIDLLDTTQYPWMNVKDLDGFVYELLESLNYYLSDEILDEFRSRIIEARNQVENENFVRKPANSDDDNNNFGIGLNPLMDNFIDKIQSKIDNAEPVLIKVEPKVDSDNFAQQVQNCIDDIFKPQEFIHPLTGEIFQTKEGFLEEFADIKDFANLDPSEYKMQFEEIYDWVFQGWNFDESMRKESRDEINKILKNIPELKSFLPEIYEVVPSEDYFVNYVDNYINNLMDLAASDNKDIGEFIYDYTSQIRQGFEGLNPTEAPKIKVDPSIDIADFSMKIIDQLKDVSAEINVNPNLNTDIGENQNSVSFNNKIDSTDIGHEAEQVETLRQKIIEVTTAVDSKTNAFKEEEQIVASAVQREILNLELLDSQLLEVISTIEKLQTTPINLDLKFLDDENIDNNVSKLLTDLDNKIKNLDIESLSKLSEALKGLKVTGKSAENLEMVAIALSEFRTSLAGMSTEENSFLSSINAILSKADELKNLVKILESSTKKIKEVEKTVDSKSDDVDKTSKSSSNKKSSDITNSINKAISKMKELQYSGSGEVFTSVFEQASQKVEEFTLKLATGEMSLEEYNKVVKQIQDNVKNGKTFTFIESDDIEQAKYAMKEYAEVVSNGNAVFKNGTDIGDKVTYTWADQNNIVHNLTLSYDKLTGALSEVHKQQKQTEKHTKSLSELFKQGWQNVKQYVMSFVGFYEIVNAVRQGITVIRELDTALTEMRKVSDESIQSLRNFQDVSFDIAQSVGTTAKQIQNSTADFMRLGETLEQAAKSAEVANILLNVSEFESIDEATESLVSMSAAFNDLDKIDIVDKLNLIGNNFAISTDGLATALQNSASALKTAQNDIDESIALATAANAVVQDTDKVGAGLRTIALRITGTEAAKEELAELGEDVDDFVVTTTSKLNEQVKSLTKTVGKDGISLLDDNGNYRSTYEILQDIADVWEQIAEEDLKTGQNRQNALLEMLAGKNRSNILASILQSPETLREAYNASVNDSDGSAQEELTKYLDSIEGRIQLFQNRLQEFWYNLIDSDVVKQVVDAGTELINILDNVISGLSNSGIPNLIVGFLTGTISLISKLTSGLGELSTVLAGVLGFSIFKGLKGKNSGGRAK